MGVGLFACVAIQLPNWTLSSGSRVKNRFRKSRLHDIRSSAGNSVRMSSLGSASAAALPEQAGSTRRYLPCRYNAALSRMFCAAQSVATLAFPSHARSATGLSVRPGKGCRSASGLVAKNWFA